MNQPDETLAHFETTSARHIGREIRILAATMPNAFGESRFASDPHLCS